MPTEPLISVIIPVYNHAHTLHKTVESLSSQTYRPLEIIIVNDGSTDSFAAVAQLVQKTFASPTLSVTIIEQANGGAPTARNAGAALAQGEFFIFWDADTIARPNMLEKLKGELDRHPEASYAYSQYKFGWKTMRSQEYNAEDLKRYNFIDTTSLIRRGALDSLLAVPRRMTDLNSPFDPTLKRFQDWDLWLTMLEHKKTGIFVPEVLYTKIVHGRKGYSSWLPRFMYRLPWQTPQVRAYNAAREIVLKKHSLS